MKLHLKVTEEGKDPYEVTTNLITLVAWERRFKRKASDMANGIGVEDLAFLAWEASKQAKIVVPAEFDKYIAKLDTVEVIAEEIENPIHAEHTDGS
jgi:hypothetical protein